MPLGSTWSVAIVGRVRDDVAADLSQPALLTDRHGWLVEGHAAADRHEVALAGRCRFLRRVEQRGVSVVDHDLAPVDAPRGVAPVRERGGLLDELHLESRSNGVGGVVEHGDVDGLGAHTADRGGTARTWFAYLADPGPDAAGELDADVAARSGRRRECDGSPGENYRRHCQRQRRLSKLDSTPYRTSSHPPLVIGSFNYDPNRSGGAAHRLSEASPKCMVAPRATAQVPRTGRSPGQSHRCKHLVPSSARGGAGHRDVDTKWRPRTRCRSCRFDRCRSVRGVRTRVRLRADR